LRNDEIESEAIQLAQVAKQIRRCLAQIFLFAQVSNDGEHFGVAGFEGG
jgi:hypothetical protein